MGVLVLSSIDLPTRAKVTFLSSTISDQLQKE